MKLPPFDYACPTSISEAVALLASHGGEAKLLAGGQSLVPMLAFRIAAPALIVTITKRNSGIIFIGSSSGNARGDNSLVPMRRQTMNTCRDFKFAHV